MKRLACTDEDHRARLALALLLAVLVYGRLDVPVQAADKQAGKTSTDRSLFPKAYGVLANDELMFAQWPKVEKLLNENKPEFIILQCGADSIKGDPITDLEYSEKSHAHATERLCKLADEYSQGRLLAMGGGGYNLANIAKGWNAVVETLIKNK